MDLKEQILVALGLDAKMKLAWQSKSEDGSTIFVSTADELAESVDISVLTEDGTTILLPVGTYKTDTGVSFRVEGEGIVAEVLETETEEEVTEEVVEEELAEDDGKEADVADWEGMEKRIQNLEDAVADLKRDKEGGDDEVEEMAEEVTEPSTNPKSIKTTEVVEFSIEELKAENERLKTELAAQPASAPLDTNKFSSDRKPMSKKDYAKLSRRERFLQDLNK
jgi:hypothetical protein